jgi:hypothetical protein
MKWRNRIAQGFSPGEMSKKTRPEWAPELEALYSEIRLLGLFRAPLVIRHIGKKCTPYSVVRRFVLVLVVVLVLESGHAE